MIMGWARFLPVAYQFSWLITLPWCVWMWGVNTLWVIPLIGVWHWISFSLTGHMIISHGNQSRWLPDSVMYTLYFMNSYIPPAIWASHHIQHHKHPDTPRDPQSPDYQGFKPMLAYYKPEHLDLRTLVKHRKNNISEYFNRYYFLIVCLLALSVIVLPTNWVLLTWLVPGSLSLNVATFSAWYTHHNFEPRERFPTWANLLFTGESQYHARHHTEWQHCEPLTAWMLRR